MGRSGEMRGWSSLKPNNPQDEPAGFAAKQRSAEFPKESSLKPNDPQDKPAGFSTDSLWPLLC